MNSHPENKYQLYALPDDWNLTEEDPPAIATEYVIAQDVVKLLTVFYGTEVEGDANEVLELPQNWGNDNREFIDDWFQEHTLTSNIRVDLNMQDNMYIPTNNNN